MFQEFEIRELSLKQKSARVKVEKFLMDNDLKLDNLDYYAGVFRDDKMLAGGGYEGDVIKGVAVSREARELNLTNKLISHLLSVGFSRGYDNIFVFTKPENEEIFKSLSFHLVGRAQKAILLESNPKGIKDYTEELAKSKRPGRSGAIVMNCNPLTSGHRYLIEKAAKQVDTLHILVVSEDKSYFSSADRLQMVKDGTADLQNVRVYEGKKYVISSATFPNYFIKNPDSVTTSQIELDLHIFSTHIAPALGINVRFIGSEPYDVLTNQYNTSIKEILPKNGIEVVELERLKKDDHFISATQVRSFINSFHLQETFSLVPETTKPYIVKKIAEIMANIAKTALEEELFTTPKPGLVDKDNNGAHTDMSLKLMELSIYTLLPYFIRLAELSLSFDKDKKIKDISTEVRTIGIEAEKSMMKATNGVNTHRGALFSIGLSITATGILINASDEISTKNLSGKIKELALQFKHQDNSNGGKARKEYNLKGALDNAQEGYSDIFNKVLPAYQQMKQSGLDNDTVNVRTLLLIISILDDTNVYHRKGKETAEEIKKRAALLYKNYELHKLTELDHYFIKNNISPGGSADMLALTIFLNKVLTLK